MTDLPGARITSLRTEGSHLIAEVTIDLDALNLVQVCAQCRQPMAGERSTKRFCSATCRSTAHRRNHQGDTG